MTDTGKATAPRSKPPEGRGRHSRWPLILTILGGVAFVVLLASRFLLFQPFNTPSSSMVPTLVIGDHFVVSKYAYGYSRFSFPFPTQFSGRILAAEPRRGDVAVFRLPRDPTTDYIKRVVGLPGDRIQMKGGVLIINDAPVPRERADDFIDDETGEHVRQWRMTLPGGVSYLALDMQDNGSLDNTQVYTVPPGHYFMLGDNLDNSTDSRVLSMVGYVPFENLVGRAEIIYFSGERFERIGRPVR